MNGLDTSASDIPATVQALQATHLLASGSPRRHDAAYNPGQRQRLRVVAGVPVQNPGGAHGIETSPEGTSATLACAKAAGILSESEPPRPPAPRPTSATLACARAASLLPELPDISQTIERMRTTAPVNRTDM